MREEDRNAAFLARAAKSLPADLFLTSKEDCSAFGSDWTRLPGQAGVVALPRTVNEVAEILKICSELKFPVVPSGGRTGLAGGAVASQGELALSLTRLNSIGEVDTLGRSVRVGAGAVTQAVHEHCAHHGLTWPIDLAAKGTSTIGGNLSTNAGGLRVIRYGMSRKWLIGLQAVTMQGEILELNHDLEKNNTGYDLIQLIAGSEGTLAVVTEVTLKLTRLPRNRSVLFFGVSGLAEMNELFERARTGPFEILAFEFFSDRCRKAVEAKLSRRSPLSVESSFYALMEIEESEPVDAWLEKILEDGVVADGTMGQSSEAQRDLWMLREGITESLQMTAPVKKYDIAVPVRKMLPFLTDVQTLFERERYQMDLYLFGHYGDGSPHLNLLKPEGVSLDVFLAEYDRLDKALFPLLKSYGGSISAEHGVGLLKKHWVTYSRTPAELRLYKAIKKAFDPDHLLNPGKVLD